MKLNKKIEKYYDMFESKERKSDRLNEDETFYVLKDDADKKLHDSVMEAHGNRLPCDFVYRTYHDLLGSISDYSIETMDDLEEHRSEIVDSQVDCYTSGLTEWLNESNYNVEYLGEAVSNGATEGFDILAQAQYCAIDEIMSEIISLLEQK